jgi:predicted CXXCH cytochrome family protein
MGDGRRQRFLKPSKDYGKLELLSVEWTPPRENVPATLVHTQRPHWNEKLFADSCAGCHTTAVDPKTQAFSALALDCVVCHGNAPLEHSKKPELAHLSRKRKEHPRVEMSICAQCHVRSGKSKSTGRPYPTNFVAGDNLFRDFEVDFSDEKLKTLSVLDRHVLENVRDVVVFGKEGLTCLSCHDVHGRSSKKHHRVPKSDYCLNCHHAEGPMRVLKPMSASSATCGY